MNYPENLPLGAEPEYEEQQRQLDSIMEFAWLAHAAQLDKTMKPQLIDMAENRPAKFSPAPDYHLVLWPGTAGSISSRSHQPTDYEHFQLNDKGSVDDPPRSFLHVIHIQVTAHAGITRMLSEQHQSRGSHAQQQTAIWHPGNEIMLSHRQGMPWVKVATLRSQAMQLAS